MSKPESARDSRTRILSLLIFAACIPQAGSLLLKVFGVCSLQAGFLLLALPGSLLVAIIYLWARKNGHEFLGHSLELGFAGGLAGTVAYDLARIPFVMFGQRIFAPISAYGIWLLDASFSTRFTEIAGWGYHFLNGISFGIMYGLFMRGRPAYLAILWGCGLETIAFLSPFGRIFGITNNPSALAIAYFGHVMYGIPLGLMIKKDQSVLAWLKSIPAALYYFALALVGACVIGQIMLPEQVTADNTTKAGTFTVQGERLSPDWQRVTVHESPTIVNNSGQTQVVVIKKLGKEIQLTNGESKNISVPTTGIYQLFVKTSGRTVSSFLIVEPVESEVENRRSDR